MGLTMRDAAMLLRDGTVVLPRPLRCAGCGTMHYWFRNEGGKTLCLHCSEKEVLCTVSR